ncbi:heme ABC exporter ATP-binding protein CcmA [Mariprofundus sp. EBB-1]|uniref:heme ABC exporter ATP-binding protein CcmA n=1 Tax=Mariprofundus sp. EBB-1 TaxID=2650971 RepID=UPI000EF221EB|nr:heme ABC exporter ATP-binding protein CcmA [Mariprofundus sp. EBB-1]RLL53647.1 heme ABC exporter ATP-binding protein CcmA [Mariprofundus sp. EBB-1]
MIKVRDLCFDYPGTRALDDVSFDIKAGNIVALVGPNGAGKTTLLRTLAALDQPVSGQILLDGKDISENPREVHQKLGYLSDFFGLYEELTVAQCLRFHAGSHGINSEDIAATVERAARRLGLDDRLHQKAKELSRGLRQRLAIAQAIVHEPKILLLDEPASGLDPEARHALATLFCQLRDQGMTLLVSSHILTELEEYCSHMLMLRHGKLIAEDGVGQAENDRCDMQLTVVDDDGVMALLSACDGVLDVRYSDDQCICFSAPDDALKQHLLLKELIDQGVAVVSFKPRQTDMHRQYLDKVQQQERDVQTKDVEQNIGPDHKGQEA